LREDLASAWKPSVAVVRADPVFEAWRAAQVAIVMAEGARFDAAMPIFVTVTVTRVAPVLVEIDVGPGEVGRGIGVRVLGDHWASGRIFGAACEECEEYGSDKVGESRMICLHGKISLGGGLGARGEGGWQMRDR
jgi:hypothetical protein